MFSTQAFNPFQDKPWFLCVCSMSHMKTLWKKEKLLVMSNFSLFPLCFPPFWRTFCHFRQIQNCRLRTLSVWKRLKCVVGKGIIVSPFINIFAIKFLFAAELEKPKFGLSDKGSTTSRTMCHVEGTCWNLC